MPRTLRRASRGLGAVVVLFALHTATALAAGPPIVTQQSPDTFKLNTAMFHGTVDPNAGGTTTFKVEYGRTKLYGQTTPAKTVTGTGAVPVSVELVGLQPMSTYHYRISATNGQGTTVSSDGLFETLLSWKVEGKRISELEAPPTFEDEFTKYGEGGAAEFRGSTAGGTQVRIYCRQSNIVNGTLDVAYTNMVYDYGCFTQLNTNKSAPCKPLHGITLHLNSFMAQYSPTKVELGEECSIGESVEFANGGYSPSQVPGSESAKFSARMEGTTYWAGREWEAEFSTYTNTTPGSWKLTGSNAGKAFGIG